MEQHEPSSTTGPTGETDPAREPEVDSDGTEGWRDMEIWKVLTGADSELDPEFLDSTYVETDEILTDE
ncbi:hypothetical protein [Streptomyces sp. UG1]|uniref:hypothetical protein n=1 Tax=Streptomyces sp. UG1 TaxID=3417652 RepID=UPI003CF289FA